jgi:hypothetical protein
MARNFTLEQARELLPRVAEDLRRAVVLKREHDKAEREIQAISRRVAEMGGVLLNREELLNHRSRLDATGMRLRETLDEVEELGVMIKDLEIGLIDFPTLYRGVQVLLCWRLGETDIEYWHGMEEGFRGRKPIDQDFLDNHQGDPVE